MIDTLLRKFSKLVGKETTLRTAGYLPVDETPLSDSEVTLQLHGNYRDGSFSFEANPHFKGALYPAQCFEQEGESATGYTDNLVVDKVRLTGRDGTRYSFECRSDGYIHLDTDNEGTHKSYTINPRRPQYNFFENEEILAAFNEEYNFSIGKIIGLNKTIMVGGYDYNSTEPHKLLEQFFLGVARVQVALNTVYVHALPIDTPETPRGGWFRLISAQDLGGGPKG